MERLVLVYKEIEDLRIDKYLASELDDMTRTQIQLLITDKNVTVNGNVIKSNYKLKLDDMIEITIPDPVECDILPENIPLDVYYEDEDLIVINKPSGMVVHPGNGNYEHTLVNALMYHCKDLSSINGVNRPGIVHRIDKDTSGLIVACKNDFSHKELSKQFMDKTVSRKYYAICHGVITHNQGKIDAPIGRNPDNRQQMGVVENGKYAKTHFKVLERFEKYTLCEMQLETGRTHQIRVHMKYIGFPVAGDPLYGPRKVVGNNGQYLHAKTLGFVHPRTGQYMEFDSPLPDFYEEFLKELREGK